MTLIGCQQEEQYLKTKMGLKPDLATTKVTLTATCSIRFANSIEEQQFINIVSLQNSRLHKLVTIECIQVKQGHALAEVYSQELANNHTSTQANMQRTCVTLSTEQFRLFRHQKSS